MELQDKHEYNFDTYLLMSSFVGPLSLQFALKPKMRQA